MPGVEISIGRARVDITPSEPVLLAGFGQRTEPSAGVHDRLYAKALVLVGAGRRVVLVTMDLLHVPGALTAALRASLADVGLGADELCVTASHTHSGPVPYAPGSAEPGVAAYAPALLAALDGLVRAALADVAPARVRTGVGVLTGLWNRRRGGAVDDAVDGRVPVFAVTDARSGALRAVLFGAGCHPTTLGWDSNLVSADYPGVAQRLVEERLGVEVALFVNTTEGDVVPATSPRRDALDARGYCGGSWADTVALGERLATAVVDVVRAAPTDELAACAAQRLEVLVPPSYAELDGEALDALEARSVAVLQRRLGERAIAPGALWSEASSVVVAEDLDDDAMRELMVAVCHRLVSFGVRARRGRSAPVAVPVHVLRLHDLSLCLLPGEALVEVGRAWSARSGSDRAFVVGLAGDHFRYLPVASHFAEVDAGERYETVTAALAPDAVDTLLDRAAAALATMEARS
jgi:hypothetical protein